MSNSPNSSPVGLSNRSPFSKAFLKAANALAYTTWNPADKGVNITLSAGNLQTTAADTSWKSVRAISGKSSGKWYWELEVPDRFCFFGLADAGAAIINNYLGAAPNSGSMGSATNAWAAGIFSFFGGVPPNGNTAGIYCIACDLDNRKVWFRKAGSAWAYGDPEVPAGTSSLSWSSSIVVYPAMSHYQPGGNSIANFGASSFADEVPAGFTPGWTA